MSAADEVPAMPIHNGVVMAAFPPPGWVVNAENPTRTAVLEHYLCFGILGTLAILALGQRFYVKMFLTKGLQLDDLFIFLAWICSMVSQCLMVNLIRTGPMGAHTWEVSLQAFLDAQIIPYIVSAVYQLCNGFTKLSLLVFYLQISPQVWWRRSIWATIIFVSLSTTILCLMLWVHCDPVAKAYDLTITHGKCLNVTVLYMLTAVQNIATDIVLFALPIPMVTQLRMGTFQKVGAIVIFGIGSMTIGTSIVRLVLLLDLLDTMDLTWVAAKANVWIIVEANLFIICASMPTLRKFFKHVAPKLMGTSSADQSAPSKYGQYGRSHNDALETVGGSSGVSRKVRRQYETFDDHELEMFDDAAARGDDKKMNLNEITIDSGRDRERSHQDNSSDKAILQTTTFDIKYDN